MRELMSNGSLMVILKTNLQDWKRDSDIDACVSINMKLKSEDVSVITSPEFYDDINDMSLDVETVLDKHYIMHLSGYMREDYISMHNIYNQ